MFSTLLLKGYRSLNLALEKKVRPSLKSEERFQVRIAHSLSERPLWFHAASVGELESLTPVIHGAAREGHPLIISIFSPSAREALEKLRRTLLEMKAQVLYCGFSPWEGSWLSALEKLHPSLLITAKYEAWPDLWVSLQQTGIPLAIVSAQARKSLETARWLCRAFVGSSPRILFFPHSREDAGPLQKHFPDASIQVVGEPRWDRVAERSKVGNSRAQELVRRFEAFPRPWVVIGSAWLDDLKFLETVLRRQKATFWVVPHQVHLKSLAMIEEYLAKLNLGWVRSLAERPESLPASCILVNELGCLSELYSVADWAFVGGGFGEGIHSTIEPALYGVPIAAGPKNADRFSEVRDLVATGQLRLVSKEGELLEWVQSLESLTLEMKKKWRQDARKRLGATEKILKAIQNHGSLFQDDQSI